MATLITIRIKTRGTRFLKLKQGHTSTAMFHRPLIRNLPYLMLCIITIICSRLLGRTVLIRHAARPYPVLFLINHALCTPYNSFPVCDHSFCCSIDFHAGMDVKSLAVLPLTSSSFSFTDFLPIQENTSDHSALKGHSQTLIKMHL